MRAEVAQRANVPAGNVYYYFKTKDELVGAVLDAYATEAAELIKTFERKQTPQARLKALVRNWDEMRDIVARHGCPMGSLCSELDKSASGLDRKGAEVQIDAESDARVFVMNGQPIDEPVAGYGPFVMNTPREIQQAFADFQAGKLGRIPADADA